MLRARLKELSLFFMAWAEEPRLNLAQKNLSGRAAAALSFFPTTVHGHG